MAGIQIDHHWVMRALRGRLIQGGDLRFRPAGLGVGPHRRDCRGVGHAGCILVCRCAGRDDLCLSARLLRNGSTVQITRGQGNIIAVQDRWPDGQTGATAGLVVADQEPDCHGHGHDDRYPLLHLADAALDLVGKRVS